MQTLAWIAVSLVVFANGICRADEFDLAALVDLPSAKERRAAVHAIVKSGAAIDDVLAAARAFSPDTVRTGDVLLYSPKRLDPAVPAPAIVYLHGSGGRGEEALGLWKRWADELGCHIVAPTDASGDRGFGYTPAERARAMAAVREARRRLNIDENRIHLTGVSRGGHMTWDLGTRWPDRWATLSPMIGGPRWLPQRGQNNMRFLEGIAHLSIRDLQGAGDQAGLLDNLRYAFKKLDRLGGQDAKLITFPKLGHSFRMEAVKWHEFLGSAKRNPLRKRVVRICADLSNGEGRSAWVEILALDRKVKEKFVPHVDGRKWPALDAMGQRAYMDEITAKKTARIEAIWTARGRFTVKSTNVRKFRLLLSSEMFVPGEGIVVTWNGRARKMTAKPSIRVLLEDFAERFDRTFLPTVELRVP